MKLSKTRPSFPRPPASLSLPLISLSLVSLAAGATVIPKEELEANKPKLLPTQSGNNLILNWEAQPEVYYFMEASPDLTTWVSAKLLKDTTQSGSLTLGTAMGSSKGFYRLSLEGDPDSSRLREDSDGDKIINILEADADMDAFQSENPADTDGDEIPDYWEQFYFGTLEHGADYVAIPGGLTAEQAFTEATNPNTLDSDGDGKTDAEELADGTDANYDQTRDNPQGDDDKDGLTNAQEHALGTKPLNKHTDSDGVEDGLDGWPLDVNFAPARQSESYALIDLSGYLTYPASGSATVQVDDNGGVLLASHSTSGSDTTFSTKYYNWSQTLTPSAFNSTLKTSKTFEQHGSATAAYTVHLTRSGLIHFSGSSSLNEDLEDGLYPSDIQNHRNFHDPFNVTYNVNNQASGTFANLSNAFTTAAVATGGASNQESVSLLGYEYSSERTASISMSSEDISDETTNTNSNSSNVLIQNGQVLSSGTTTSLLNSAITLSRTAHFQLLDTGAYGTQLATHHPEYSFSPLWDVFPFTYPAPDYPESKTRWKGGTTDGDAVVSAQGQDILIDTENSTAHSYSLNSSTFYDFLIWNPSSKQLQFPAVGKTSDDLVMLSGDSNILINQTKRSVSDLVSNAEGWSNFKLQDINSHSMIVGTAQKGGATKVIALLKVDVEIHDEDGNPQLATEDNPANVPVNGDFDEEKQVNGRYVRDYEDANLLKGSGETAEIQTDDLRGCVVNIPGLTDDVWQNTTLKIRKKAGVIDPLTDEEESGEIRIHAIDADDNWVNVPLDTDLAPDHYVSTGQYADYDSCWIEGIKDGPITIEVEIVINGGTPILVEKKAMICTEKTKAEWQQETYKDIELMLGIDISNFSPNAEFSEVDDQVAAIYNYYGLFYGFEESGYLWMGLAKLAGAEAYAGMFDSSQGSNVLLTFIAFTPYDDTINDDALELLSTILQEGAFNIFKDIAWQFKAYHTSGLCALQHEFINDADAVDFSDWQLIDNGIENGFGSGFITGSENLLRREQFDVIQPSYDQMASLLWVWVANWFGKNPVPGGSSFNSAVPDGNLMDENDRWDWIIHQTKGIWPRWIYTPSVQRKIWVDMSVEDLAEPHSWLIN